MGSVKHSKKKAEKRKGWEVYMLPVLFFVTIYPLILDMVMVTNDLAGFEWFSQESSRVDFFLYTKSRVLLAGAVIMLILLLDIHVIEGAKLYIQKSLAGLLVFGAGAILSSMMSPRRHEALWGGVESCEGAFAVLAYLLLVIYSMTVILNAAGLSGRFEKAAHILFAGSGFILAATGISQLIGKDLIRSKPVLSIIARGPAKEMIRYLEFADTSSGLQKVYLTLFSFDEAGIYLTMLLPLVLLAAEKSRHKMLKAMYICLSVLLMICLIGTGARAVMAAFAITMISGIIFRNLMPGEKEKKGRFPVAILLLLILIPGVIYVFVQRGSARGNEPGSGLEAITPKKSRVEFVYEGQSYMAEPQNILKAAGKGKLTLTQGSDGYYRSDEPAGIGLFTQSLPEEEKIDLYYNGIVLAFVKKSGDERFCFINQFGNRAVIENADKIARIPGALFNHRGYIWSRAAVLLKKHILLGCGQDQFVCIFPQNDYVGKADEGSDFFGQIVIGPHSIYLQNALQSGILAALAGLISVAAVVVGGIRVLRKKGCNGDGLFVFYITLSLVNYLICGLLNDSCVAVAPLFWLLLGAEAGFCAKTMKDQG
ncbi:MAG: O-antigen ligase family protein [Lachnospiraceae bacterium]|nr:O-antigen ligase family protein [Lachnospiraceae bacterium]